MNLKLRKNNNVSTENQNKMSKFSLKSNKRTWKSILIAIYISFILLSTIPFMADKVIESQMEDSYESHLIYKTDGQQAHYYVERFNKSLIGSIDVTYTTGTNSLTVSSKNIEVLRIDCRSLYEEECKKIFGFDTDDNSNYYKWYFIEKNHLTINVESTHKIKELSFIDTPIPYEVYVNGLIWVEGIHYNYTKSYYTILSNVPMGKIHVDIYFKSDESDKPQAKFSVDKDIINVNTLVYFDASGSFDSDGEIKSYIWDFGDGVTSGGMVNAHSYSEPGVYGVILTVRDSDSKIDQEYKNITVVQGSNRPVINGIVPNQIKPEDSPAWELNLRNFGIDLESSIGELRWYLTGENNSLYHVVGENSTDQKLIFSAIPNAFGNNLVTLWLMDKDGFTANQEMWINLTPVNDIPIIDKLPDLVVHYELPYHFSISLYINDIETPRDELTITAHDKYGDKYIKVDGQSIEFLYPKDFINQIILVTVVVSDGQDSASSIIAVTISDNWPPILINKIPDVVLEEGTARYDVFNLDSYFSDPDGDELYYTYSKSNVVVLINENKSVDFISLGEWTGEENILFRARDSDGAFVEDVIRIRVLPINDPPTIGEVPDLMVHFDMDYYFDISYYVQDKDNKLGELTLITSDPEHIRISPNNNLGLILNYPKSMLGISTKIVLIVFDGISEASKIIQVTVIEEFPPELIKKLPDVVFNEDESMLDLFDLDDYFLDLDNDTLYYTSGNKMINITINNQNRVSFFVPRDWFGIEEVTFRAIDPIGALVEDSIMVTVISKDDPPVLMDLPKITIQERETLEFDLSPYIVDVDTNISNIILKVDNDNVLIKGSSLILFGSKELPSEIYITVSDGELTTSGSLEIVVVSKAKSEDNLLSVVILSFVILILIILSVIILILRHRHLKNQKFDVEEIFLIHNSGKLLNHVYCKTHSKFDDEIFSGMFTAIQEFIEDTFTRDSEESGKSINNLSGFGDDKSTSVVRIPMKLNEFKVGDNQVIIEHGKFIFMAVVYTGPGANTLHRVIKQSINEIEAKFGDNLEFWDGDIKQVSGIKKFLEELLPKKVVLEKYEDIYKIDRKHKSGYGKKVTKPIKKAKNISIKDLKNKL